MPKQLVGFCVIIFSLCAIGSSLINYQTAHVPKNIRELAMINNSTLQRTDWLTILEKVPQYKEPEVAANIQIINSPQISDSQIIGIVTDKSNSVLIYINQSDLLTPLQLTVGEGWLPNWKIKQINPDSVVWFNDLSREFYSQLLFNDKNAKQKKLSTKNSGNK